ncbi:MAG: hypothetical protein GY910_10500 [bacterium]|nr:hypothetical protein [bacterium]
MQKIEVGQLAIRDRKENLGVFDRVELGAAANELTDFDALAVRSRAGWR